MNTQIEKAEQQDPNQERIVDDVDLRQMLKVSRRTTYNYRIAGLKHYTIKKKTYYFMSDVYDFIRKSGGR